MLCVPAYPPVHRLPPRPKPGQTEALVFHRAPRLRRAVRGAVLWPWTTLRAEVIPRTLHAQPVSGRVLEGPRRAWRAGGRARRAPVSVVARAGARTRAALVQRPRVHRTPRAAGVAQLLLEEALPTRLALLAVLPEDCLVLEARQTEALAHAAEVRPLARVGARRTTVPRRDGQRKRHARERASEREAPAARHARMGRVHPGTIGA